MPRRFVLPVVILLASVPAWAADAPSTTAPAQPSPEQAVAQFRTDLQAKRADVMAKNLSLSAEQAAKFWPLFEQFQKEQNVIIDAQARAIQKLATSYDKLSDAQALEYVNALLTRDDQMHALRVKWLAKFQSVVPTKTAARAIQIDRRLGQATQVALSSQVPLVQ
jgi:Spy/CpxP family protein refolding chaperone